MLSFKQRFFRPALLLLLSTALLDAGIVLADEFTSVAQTAWLPVVNMSIVYGFKPPDSTSGKVWTPGSC